MIRGKVVLVPFPFDDFSGTKVRPGVCLTDPIGTHRHVILAFISSRVPADLLETDFILDSAQGDFAATGLRVSSTLRLHRLMTVSIPFLQRELGELSLRMQDEVNPVRKSSTFQRGGSPRKTFGLLRGSHGALNPVFALKGIISSPPLQAAGLSNGVNNRLKKLFGLI